MKKPKKIASELMIERLIDWGVDTVFGLPGDGINGIMEGLRRHQDRIRFVLVHHEESAAFMATGYAKATGRLGVCVATSGPGGLHLINGLYDAKLDHVPVLAITGVQGTQLLGTGHQQEVHLDRVFMDLAEYNVMVHGPTQIPALVDRAVRTAFARRTVSHITFPVDMQEADPEESPWEGGLHTAKTPDSAPIYIPPPAVPDRRYLESAAELLNRGKKVVVLAGVGAIGAREEILSVAERLAAPIVKTLPGKAAVPDDHPLSIGGLGLLGTKPSEEAMEDCDTLFMIGTQFPYTRFLPEGAHVVCLDVDPTRSGTRVPTEVPLVGEAAPTLRALLPLLQRNADRSFLERAQKEMEKWTADMDALADPDREPIQPQYLMALIDRYATDDAIVSADSGTGATWAARHLTIRGKRQFMLSGNLATMAPGLPYTIAAQVAYPGRQCIAFVGDGAFAMLMAEFHTACRYELPIKVFVINNGVLGMILWEQMALGYPEFGVRFEKPLDFVPWAQSCGGHASTVEKPGGLEAAVRDTLAFNGPALLDVRVNPDEPPMPAKVDHDQAINFARAFLRGQPRRVSIAATIARDKIEQLKS